MIALVRHRTRLAVLMGLTSLLWTLPAALVVAAESEGDSGPLLARAFEIRYRSLGDAADLVSTVLSEDGSVKLRPRIRTLVVEDGAAVLAQVESLLRSFDVPPRNVEITLTLLLGTDTRDSKGGQGMGPGAVSREVRGITESLPDFTKWSNYELLGSQTVTAAEGHTASARLSEEYAVTFEVLAVRPPSSGSPQGGVSFKSVTLERVSLDRSGAESRESLYSTAIRIPAGKLFMVGAARSPESKKALFLTIKARPV